MDLHRRRSLESEAEQPPLLERDAEHCCDNLTLEKVKICGASATSIWWMPTIDVCLDQQHRGDHDKLLRGVLHELMDELRHRECPEARDIERRFFQRRGPEVRV